MRVPLRAFSFDLPIRKKSSGGSNSSSNGNNKHLNLNLGHNHNRDDNDHNSDKSPPTTPTSPTTKTRRGSAGRLLSKASQLRLRVTARASSLDLLHTHSSSRISPRRCSTLWLYPAVRLGETNHGGRRALQSSNCTIFERWSENRRRLGLLSR